MGRDEAETILDEELDRFRAMLYEDLAAAIEGSPCTCERAGPSGTIYQVEIEIFWENSKKERICVVGTADEIPHRPIFAAIPVLRWLPIYHSSGRTFSRNQHGMDDERKTVK